LQPQPRDLGSPSPPAPVVLDDIYGVDVLRKVIVIHGERLYVLTFVPWVGELEEFPRIKELYETIVSTMEFLQ